MYTCILCITCIVYFSFSYHLYEDVYYFLSKSAIIFSLPLFVALSLSIPLSLSPSLSPHHQFPFTVPLGWINRTNISSSPCFLQMPKFCFLNLTTNKIGSLEVSWPTMACLCGFRSLGDADFGCGLSYEFAMDYMAVFAADPPQARETQDLCGFM